MNHVHPSTWESDASSTATAVPRKKPRGHSGLPVRKGLWRLHWCSASTRTVATYAHRGHRPAGAGAMEGLNPPMTRGRYWYGRQHVRLQPTEIQAAPRRREGVLGAEHAFSVVALTIGVHVELPLALRALLLAASSLHVGCQEERDEEEDHELHHVGAVCTCAPGDAA
eukprot:scaffold18996_cov57-Phaeocystis_antarctica.AAC.2